MAPKRKAEALGVSESPEPRPARAAKVAKKNYTPDTSKETKHKKKAAPKGKRKPTLTQEEFKAGALPLHINISHAPPPIDRLSEESQASGWIGHVVLPPTVFSTKRYGWKGSNKLQVELENPNTLEKTKVWVQLTINATVLGSKPTEEGEEGDIKDETMKDE